MPPGEATDIAVMQNEVQHLKDAINELTDRVSDLTEAVHGIRVSQAKLAGMLAIIGTAGGGAGAVISKMFF